jgi:hypothetical protein
MKCPNCGNDNPDDYKFCIHCGVPHTPAAPEEIELQSTAESPAAPPHPDKTGHALIKQKWFIALLVGVVLLCCLVVAAAAVFVLVKNGTISLGGGGGDNILIGVPSRSSQSDLYTLRLGKELSEGTLLAEDVFTSGMYLSYQKDGESYALGNYFNHFGGFIPQQKLLVIWYEDEDGDLVIQRYTLNQDAPLPVFDSNEGNGYGQVFDDGQDVFINEQSGTEERCYTALDGEPAQRITKGEDCALTPGGAFVLTAQVNDNETTLSLMNLDGSGEVTLLDAQPDVASYRAAFDGSRVAYVTGESEQQIIVLDGRTAAVLAQSEPVFRVLSYSFAQEANTLIYIAETDEGELELYLLEDSGAVLVASGMYLNAEISPDGGSIVYMVGDENAEYTVAAYNPTSGQSTQILQGDDLRISLAYPLERVFITQQDEDELTVYSARLDGSDLVTLFSDNNAYLGMLIYVPDRSDLFLYVSNGDGENSLFYTPSDDPSGYYLLEEYLTLEVRDVSPDKQWLLAVAAEDANDDPALVAVSLQPEQAPLVLDESEDGFTTAVFSADSRSVLYTALTGYNPDDSQIRRAALNDEQAPETLYDEAYLVDVQWTQLAPFRGIYFGEPQESTSFCPGAPTITVGSTMEGAITESGEVCYRFTSTADQMITFNVEAEFDTLLTLYDRDGYQIDRDDDSGPGLNPRLVASLATPGAYYIVVSSYGSSTGRYSFSMQEGISDASQAVPLESNVRTRDYINSSDGLYLESSDYATYGVLYSFDGTINEQIRIDVIANSQGSEIDSYIYLYDASMNLLITDDDSGDGYDSQLIYTLPATGKYYLLVEDLGGDYGPESTYWFDILLTR